MDMQQYASAFRSKWWIMLLAGLLGFLAGLAFTVISDSQYRAVSSVYMRIQLDETPSVLSQVSGYMANQVETYAELADKPIIQSQVVDQLGLQVQPSAMLDSVSAGVPEDTYAIDIVAETDNRQQSIDIANSTASVLSDYVNSTEPQMNGQSLVQMSITAPALDATAELPSSAVFPVVGLLLGLLAGAVLALIFWDRGSSFGRLSK